MYDKKFLDELKKQSPLELSSYLEECEFYERISSEEIIQSLNEEFSGKSASIKGFVLPAFSSIISGIGNELNIKSLKSLDKKGITVDRLYDEFNNFDYYEDNGIKDNYIDIKEEENIEPINKYDRKNYEDVNKLNKYKKERFSENKNRKTIEDDIQGKAVYKSKKDAEKRNFKNKTEHTPNIDHVVPLKEKFKELENNPLLDKKDKKEICNIPENYEILTEKLNKSKGDKTNAELIKKNKDLTKEEKSNLLEKDKKAKSSMNHKQNDIVLDKLKNDPKKAFKKIKNSEVTKMKINNVKSEALDSVIGDTVILCAKAGFYEFKDSIENGIKYKTNETTKVEAFKYRIKRAFSYILSKVKNIFSKESFNFVKNIIKTLLSIIVDLFAGVVRSIGKIIVKGFTSIISSIKILMTKSSEMSYSEKAEAIVKIISSLVVASLGTVIDSLLGKIGMPEKPKKICSIIISAFLVALVGYFIDKLDLFSNKLNLRLQRINEVFDMRIEQLKDNTIEFKNSVEELITMQLSQFDENKQNVLNALSNDDYIGVSEGSFEIAAELNVNLEYSNVNEFFDYLDDSDEITIGEKNN